MEQVPGITTARVSLDPPVASLDMELHVGLTELKEALKNHPNTKSEKRLRKRRSLPPQHLKWK